MKKFQLSEKMKNVTKISSGTVLGQIISIVTLPFITRLYSAEVIGIWTTVTAFANIIQNITDLGLANALMICDRKRMPELFNIIVRINLALSILSGGIVFFYYLLTGETAAQAAFLCVLLIIYAYALKNINIYSIILNRDKEYNVLMKNPMLRFTSTAVISIVLGMLGVKSGYYIGTIMGQILPLLHMRRYVPKHNPVREWSAYKEAIAENKDFIKYQLPASVTVNLRTELPNLLISSLFGNTVLGYYSISQKLLTIPVTFLGQALGTVFYQNIASMKRKGQEIGAFVARNMKRAMVLACIPMILLSAYGDAAITIFFGSEYSIGGVICRIIVYRSLFNFVSTATRGIDIVLEKQKYMFYTTLGQTILAIASVLTGYYVFDSIYTTSILLTVTFIIVQVIYFGRMYQVMGMTAWTYLKEVIIMLAVMTVGSVVLRYGFFALVEIANVEWLTGLLNYFVM